MTSLDLQLLAALVYAPGVCPSPSLLPQWGDSDPWLLYQIARTAMRNGHSQTIARPVLQHLLTLVCRHVDGGYARCR
jgi:hypothetical protein